MKIRGKPSIFLSMIVLVLMGATLRAGDTKMFVLDNGLRVIFTPNPANNILAMNCLIHTGSAIEFPQKKGVTNFTQTLLMKGTRKRRAEEIALDLESIGASIGTDTHEDYAEVSAVAIVQDADVVIELLADILFNPTFPPAEVEKERRNILDGIRLKEDNKFYLTYKNFLELIYGESHPYGLPVEGTLETVSSLTREDIVTHYEEYYAPSNMILSVVADLEEDELSALLERHFPEEKSPPPIRFYTDKEPRPRSLYDAIEKQVEQGFIIAGYITCDVESPDYVPLKVLSAVLGEGMSSRLFVRLRDEMGLAYSVGCGMPTRKLRTHFFAWIGTKPESIERAREGIINEFDRIKKEGVSEEELNRAKKYLIGRFLLDHQTNLRRAWYKGWYEILGVGMQFDEVYPELVEKVTAQDIKYVADKYFQKPAVQVLQPPMRLPEQESLE